MSRLTFDEIFDFIIAADVEQIKLLFRRPKKERSSGKRGEMEKGTSVKWMDVDPDEKTKKRGKKKKVYPKEAEEGAFSDDDNTMGEETMGEETMGEDTMGDDTLYTEVWDKNAIQSMHQSAVSDHVILWLPVACWRCGECALVALDQLEADRWEMINCQ
jgi:hypothetical protein